MEFHVFDVGHGFCALLVADNGNVVLFDCGHDDAAFRPSVYLPSQGISTVHDFHLSHFDSDHVSDLPNLRARVAINQITRNVTMPAVQIRQQKLQSGPLDAGLASAIQVHEAYTAPVVAPPNFPGIETSVYCNRYPLFSDTNNLSMVTFLHSNGFHAVVPGDLEAAGWRELLKDEAFRSHLRRTNVFIASHHGRENGYCPEVFNFCSPEIVIISDSEKQYDSQEHNYDQHATGVRFGSGITRKVLTTRRDGHVSFYGDAASTTVQTSRTLPVIRWAAPLPSPFLR
jgi:beta-lactamase superfamily II metal-dependent hydrolase